MPRLSPQPTARADVARVLKIQVPVIVKLAEKKFVVSEVLRLQIGSILEFAKPADAPLELLINNKAIAVGDAVKVGENFGLRLKSIGDVKQIIASMAR